MRLVLGLLLLLAMLAQAGDAPRVRFLWPQRLTDDQSWTIWTVQVEPHPDNRLLILAAYDGDGPVRRTFIELEGERAKRTHRVEWRSALPAGELLIVASVLGSQKELARATVPITVVGMRP
jgi:hypothetical protein